MIGSPLRNRLLEFTAEVETNPEQYGPATLQFIQEANEIIGARIKQPLVGWVVPRGTVFAARHPRIAGIELNAELRKGCILTRREALTCAEDRGPNSVAAVRQLLNNAAHKMNELI
jgi:hypothetical protein